MTTSEWVKVDAAAQNIRGYNTSFFQALFIQLKGAELIVPDKKTYSQSAIRIKMDEAKEYLILLGIPADYINKMTVLTFLALINVTPDTLWRDAKKESMGLTKDIMTFVAEHYHLEYKTNTRESFRREGINILINYGIIDLNPDNKHLGPTSPQTHYAVKDKIISKIRVTRLSPI